MTRTGTNRHRIVFDIEANGFYEGATVVHCIGTKGLSETQRQVSPNVATDVEWVLENILTPADVLIGHNIIGYDIPVLHKIHGWKPRPETILIDTYLMSTVLCPDIEDGHSLEAWGKRLGILKGEYTGGFAEYTSEMGAYCAQDVNVTLAVYDHLMKLVVEQEKIPGANPRQAIKLEHDFAKLFTAQWMRGVYVDRPKAERLAAEWDATMADIEARIEPRLPQTPMNKGELDEWTPPKIQFKKGGTPSAIITKWCDKLRQDDATGVWTATKSGIEFTLPRQQPVTVVRPMQLKDQAALKGWLMSQGWLPTMWSYKKEKDRHGKLRPMRDADGEPIRNLPKFHDKGVLCEGLTAIESSLPEVAEVVTWLVLRHRLGLVRSILGAIRPDGTVPATGMSNGTPTARVTHQVVANFPTVDMMYGEDCRSILTARPGRVVSSTDASGLETRCLAHYMGDATFNDTVVHGTKEEGTDIITLMWQVNKQYIVSRKIGKPTFYGYLYGASDKKTGQTAQHPDAKAKAIGKKIKERWLESFPALAALQESLAKAAKRGFLIAIDGRVIPLRSSHAALNTLLQSCGSILVKTATVYQAAKAKAERLNAVQVLHYHDEVMHDCDNEATAARVGALFVEGIKYAEAKFKFRCPLDGDTQIGRTWAEVH